MKAYRRGEQVEGNTLASPRRADGGLWWFGAGSIPAWPGDPYRHYLYRGAHRANRFSRRVADIAEEIANDPPRRWVVRKLSPTCDLMNDGCMVFHNVLMRFSPPAPDRGVVMLIQPAGGVASIPALDLDLVSRA